VGYRVRLSVASVGLGQSGSSRLAGESRWEGSCQPAMVGKTYSLSVIPPVCLRPFWGDKVRSFDPSGFLLGAAASRTKSCWPPALGTGFSLGLHFGDLDEMVCIDPSLALGR
jgi:hypothetical protein